MTNGIFTVAILGVGARGGNVYGKLMKKQPDKYKITHLCDMRKDRLEYYGELFGVPENQRYTSEDDIFAERKADILVIGTQDNDHVRHAIRAFETGYDILVEKPLSDNEEECLKLLEAQKKSDCKALVCHVLRYAPAYRKLYEIVNSGILGKIVSINWTEAVAYWHQAHSYVRGNWRNTDIAAPMILAKCCHDLDLIQWFAKSKCRSVSSVGSLDFFKPECAPEGATKHCTDCPHKNSCPYSAYKIYWEKWEKEDYRARFYRPIWGHARGHSSLKIGGYCQAADGYFLNKPLPDSSQRALEDFLLSLKDIDAPKGLNLEDVLPEKLIKAYKRALNPPKRFERTR